MRGRNARCASVALLLVAAVSLTTGLGIAHAQEPGNVVVFEVTEPGFIFDGKAVFDAQFKSTKGAPLIVEPVLGTRRGGPSCPLLRARIDR